MGRGDSRHGAGMGKVDVQVIGCGDAEGAGTEIDPKAEMQTEGI